MLIRMSVFATGVCGRTMRPVEPATEPSDAEMTALPVATAATFPKLSMVATAGLDEAQLTVRVTSAEPEAYTAAAWNGCVAPGGSTWLFGVTVKAVSAGGFCTWTMTDVLDDPDAVVAVN